MRKRKLCMFCLPIILWLIMAGAGIDRKSGRDSCPWQEGSRLWVEGVIDQIVLKEEKQSIYIKNISISDESNSSSADSADKTVRIKAELQQNIPSLQIGNKVKIMGVCQHFSKADNDGAFDAQRYYASLYVKMALKKAEVLQVEKRIDYLKETCRQIRETCKQILSRLLTKEEAGVMESLLLGDKSELDGEIRDLYQRNGIIHVLAISGLHVSMIGTSLFHFLKKRKLSFLQSSVVAGSIIWLYGILTGFSVSSTRAIIMFYIFLGAQILGRSTDLPTSMTVAAVLMLMKNPQLFFQSGFLLSYGAVAGVAVASELPLKQGRCSALWISIITWLMTFPLTAYFYYQVPVYGIVLNLFVIPSMSVIVSLGLLGMLCGFLHMAAGSFVLAPVHYILQVTFFLCRQCSRLPGAVWITGRPALWQIIGYYVVLAALFAFLRKKRKIDLIKTAFGIILGIGILCYRGNQNWSVTFLSVGQGDGICIQTEKGHTWMTDGGSSTQKNLAKYCLEPYLKYHGVREVEGWMISHFDQDHVSGLIEILECYERGITGKNQNGITIKRLLLPDTEQEEALQTKILTLAEKNQIPVIRCARGDQIEQDQMQIKILQPISKTVYENANAGSMVTKVSYQDFSVLLTGDLEGEGEAQLLENEDKTAGVLKVAHHGSKNSSSEEVLQAIGAKVAVISCGKENRYGHPHQELLKRLEEYGCQILRTDQEGMIRFTVKKEGRR